ncbi:hypothetical protein [Vibrio alfacsensis]|uniref:hypothetical protein n=1 Tax=Vibrio alfacsensis TaxID=1074311 RepID=UPI004067EB27
MLNKEKLGNLVKQLGIQIDGIEPVVRVVSEEFAPFENLETVDLTHIFDWCFLHYSGDIVMLSYDHDEVMGCQEYLFWASPERIAQFDLEFAGGLLDCATRYEVEGSGKWNYHHLLTDFNAFWKGFVEGV